MGTHRFDRWPDVLLSALALAAVPMLVGCSGGSQAARPDALAELLSDAANENATATPNEHDGSPVADGGADRETARPDGLTSLFSDAADDSANDALATSGPRDGSTVLDGGADPYTDHRIDHDAASTGGAEGGPACVPTGPEICDGKDNDCDGVIDNGFAWQGMPVGTSCYPGVGACINKGVVICASPSASTCSAMPGNPDESYKPTAAPNGSWDWNCNNGVDRRYPLAPCEMFTASMCPKLGWEPIPGEGGDCGQDLIQRSCSASGGGCQATGAQQLVTEACK